MRKFLIRALCAAFLVFFSSPSHALEGHSVKHVLDNGLTVLVTEMPSSPVVSVYGLVKTGAATEGKYLGSGISHFIEHMLFKGTHQRGVGELAARIQSVGGSINASTSLDYTIYTITVPKESFDIALGVLSDMLINATMDADEVERERNVILGEMRMRNDDPDMRVHELTFKNVFIRHPYLYPIIGYKSLLEKITRDDLIEYYQNRYAPNNIVLSVAGNVDTDEALTKIEQVFKDVERRNPVVRNLPEEPAQISRRQYEESYPTELARMTMSYSSIALLDPDLYALDVLAEILGQGQSSRLYLNVYKKQGLVLSISASNYTPIDKGIFLINCLLEQEKVKDAMTSVLKEVDEIKKNGVTPAELKKAKQQARSGYVFDHQTSASVAYAQAVDEAYAGDYHFSEKYVEGIQRVTLDDIRRVANKYLDETALTTVILEPEKRETQQKSKTEETESSTIEKYALDNGLTVLLKEDHAFPLITIRLVANGGTREETKALNGLFSIMASMWTRGTKNHSSNEIAEITEGLGMELSGFSGRNSFGLSMEFLSEQLPTGMDLLKELIVSPTFPKGEIVKVKEKMKTIIRQRQDDIFDETAHVLKETLFLTHPFRLETEGTMESVDRVTRKDLVDYFNEFVVPRNMVLTVIGDMDAQDVLKSIKRNFDGLKDKKLTLKTYSEKPPEKTREEILKMDKEQAMVMFGFQGLPFSDKDSYGLEVLAEILGSSFNGRLFSVIREQLGDAYTLGGGSIPGPDMGFVYFYVLTTESEVEKVKGLIKDEIISLQDEKVSEKELKDIKTYLKGEFKASQETISSLGFIISLDELYGLGYGHYQNYDKLIDAVTQEDIMRLARKYLDLDKAAIVITIPEKTAP